MPFELLEDISSNANDFVNSAWLFSRVTAEQDVTTGPSGLVDGTRFTWTDSGIPTVDQVLFDVVAGKELPITAGVWARIDPGQGDDFRIEVMNVAADQSTVMTGILTESWQLVRVTHTFSSNYVNSEFQTRIFMGTDGSSGDTFYLSHPFVYVDCRHIDVQPSPNYQRRDEKIEDIHRTRVGGRFVYKWGDIEQTKFNVEFVTSREQALINSWWNNNTQLMWIVDTGTQISSVQLTNRRLPIGKFATPLLTEYNGIIELATY